MSAAVHYAVENGMAVLTIDNQPKMNAMSFDMWASLPDHVARAEADPAVRAIALTGAGEKAFCAGADISQFAERRTSANSGDYEGKVSGGMRAILNAKKPTIALIRGICFGGGLALALTCDIRLAMGGSRFRIPAARLGLGYGYDNILTLVRKIGVGPASDILISARIMDAAEAQRLGVLTKMWPAESFESEANAYLQMIAVNAPLTLAAIKGAFNEIAKLEDERNKAAVDVLTAACYASEDYIEGQAAFREKRDPQFRGQ